MRAKTITARAIIQDKTSFGKRFLKFIIIYHISKLLSVKQRPLKQTEQSQGNQKAGVKQKLYQ
jgi:hypothetical protein